MSWTVSTSHVSFWILLFVDLPGTGHWRQIVGTIQSITRIDFSIYTASRSLRPLTRWPWLCSRRITKTKTLDESPGLKMRRLGRKRWCALDFTSSYKSCKLVLRLSCWIRASHVLKTSILIICRRQLHGWSHWSWHVTCRVHSNLGRCLSSSRREESGILMELGVYDNRGLWLRSPLLMAKFSLVSLNRWDTLEYFYKVHTSVNFSGTSSGCFNACIVK